MALELVGYIDEQGQPRMLPERRNWLGVDKDYEKAVTFAKTYHSDSLLYRGSDPIQFGNYRGHIICLCPDCTGN